MTIRIFANNAGVGPLDQAIADSQSFASGITDMFRCHTLIHDADQIQYFTIDDAKKFQNLTGIKDTPAPIFRPRTKILQVHSDGSSETQVSTRPHILAAPKFLPGEVSSLNGKEVTTETSAVRFSIPDSYFRETGTTSNEEFLSLFFGRSLTEDHLREVLNPGIANVTTNVFFGETVDDLGETVMALKVHYELSGHQAAAIVTNFLVKDIGAGFVTHEKSWGMFDVFRDRFYTPVPPPAGLGTAIMSRLLQFYYSCPNITEYSVAADQVGTYAWRNFTLPLYVNSLNAILERLEHLNDEYDLHLSESDLKNLSSPADVTNILVMDEVDLDLLAYVEANFGADSQFDFSQKQLAEIARRPGVIALLDLGGYSFGWTQDFKAAHPQFKM